MNVVESDVRCRKRAKRRPDVSMCFGSLTCYAVSGPASDVTIHSMPDKTLCHNMLCGSDARVRQIVSSIKNCTSILVRGVRVRITCGNVTDNLTLRNGAWYLFELE